MANIADGWLEIEPLNENEISAFKSEILNYWAAFSYGGEPAIEVKNQKLSITFSGRWTCDAAWDAIDSMLGVGCKSIVSSALLKAKIMGRGTEYATGYQAMVKKDCGAVLLKRYRKRHSRPS